MGRNRSLRAWQALVFATAMAGNSAVISQDVALVGAAFVDLNCWKSVTAPISVTPHESLYSSNLEMGPWLKLLHEPLQGPLSAMDMSSLPLPRVHFLQGAPTSLFDLIRSTSSVRAPRGLNVAACVLKMEQLPMYERLIKVENEKQTLENRVRDLEANYHSAAEITTDLVQRLTAARTQMIALEEELARIRAKPVAPDKAIVNGQAQQ